MSMIAEYQDLDPEILERYKKVVKSKREKSILKIWSFFKSYAIQVWIICRISLGLIFYFFGSKLPSSPCTIHKDIRYSSNRPRNIMDIYKPTSKFKTTGRIGNPVVVMIHGGGWVHGLKTQHVYLGQKLAYYGITTVIANYSLFPAHSNEQQVDDVAEIMKYVNDHIQSYDGNPANITLMGQSAGAHLITHYLVSNYLSNLNRRPNIKKVIGLAGPYDMAEQFLFLAEKGKEQSHIIPLCGGVKGLKDRSVTYRISQYPDKSLDLPSIYLLYGDFDDIIPLSVNDQLFKLIQKKSNCHVQMLEYNQVGHINIAFVLEDQNSDPNNTSNRFPFHTGTFLKRDKQYLQSDILQIINQ